METRKLYDAFFGTVFSPIHTVRLLKDAFSKASVSISVFGRFSVNDTWKRIQKYAFSYKDGLVLSGLQNSHKALNTYHQG